MISVIICTYNRAKYIGPLLESIAANDLPKSEYEIILVDNNCTDNTREVCDAFTKAHKDVQFQYVVEPNKGYLPHVTKVLKRQMEVLLSMLTMMPWWTLIICEIMLSGLLYIQRRWLVADR